MKLLYLSQWFEPEPTLKGLGFVKALQRRGMECAVVTGFPNYPGGNVYPGYRIYPFQRERIEDVRIDRLPLYPSHDGSSLGRMLNYASFFFSTFAYLLAQGRRHDAMLVYHPPITPAFAAALLCRWNRTPFAIDIQDLWPDSVAASGMPAARLSARLLNWVCDYTYKRATLISVQSAGFHDELVRRGVSPEKIRLIYNWADEDAAAIGDGEANATPQAPDEKFTFVYAGNFGVAQDLTCLIDAAETAARTNDRIRLVLIGGGIEAGRIGERAARSGGVVTVHPSVPRSEIGRELARADVLAAHLKPDRLYDMTIPSKVPFYMAMGRPVLAAIGGEAGVIVSGSGSGLAAAPGNSRSIADAMLEMASMSRAELDLMGRRARSTYDERFAFERGLEATTRLLQDLVPTVRRS